MPVSPLLTDISCYVPKKSKLFFPVWRVPLLFGNIRHIQLMRMTVSSRPPGRGCNRVIGSDTCTSSRSMQPQGTRAVRMKLFLPAQNKALTTFAHFLCPTQFIMDINWTGVHPTRVERRAVPLFYYSEVKTLPDGTAQRSRTVTSPRSRRWELNLKCAPILSP